MSELLDQVLKEQGRETLKKSLETRIGQYTQVRDLAQAHALVLEKMGETESKDWKECQDLIKDSNLKITTAKQVLEEIKA